MSIPDREARRLARRIVQMQEGHDALVRATQLAWSTVPVEVDGEPVEVSVPVLLEQGAHAAAAIPALESDLAEAAGNVEQLRSALVVLEGTTLPALHEAIQVAQATADSTVKVHFEADLGEGARPALNDTSDLGDLYYRLDGQVERWMGSTKSPSWALVEDTVLASTIEALRAAEATIASLNDTVLPALDARLDDAEGELTALDGRLDTAESDLTAAKTDLSTAKTDLGTLKTTTVPALEGRLTTAEQELSTAEGELATLNSTTLPNLSTEIAKRLPKINTAGSTKEFRDVLTFTGVNGNANICIETPITFSNYMTRLTIEGYNYHASASDVSAVASVYTYSPADVNGPGTLINRVASSKGTARVGVRFAKTAEPTPRLVVILSPASLPGGVWAYPKITVDALLSLTTAPDSFASGWTGVQVAEADLATRYVSILGPTTAQDLQDTHTLTQGWRATGKTTIDGGKIETDSVTAAQIKAGAVTADELAAGAVIAGKVGADAITANNLAVGAITAAKAVIAAGAILEANIADAAIGTAKIKDAAILSAKIADGQILTAKIADAAIVDAKIDNLSAVKLTAGTLDAARIGARSIDATKLVADTITANEIAADAITATELAVGAITAAKAIIANGAIQTAQIADLAVTNAKVSGLSATKITADTLHADRIGAGSITATKLGALAVTAEKIDAGAVTATKLGAGAVTAEKIDAGAVTSEKITAADITGKSFVGSKYVILGTDGSDLIRLDPGLDGTFATFGSGDHQATIGSDGRIGAVAADVQELSLAGDSINVWIKDQPRGVIFDGQFYVDDLTNVNYQYRSWFGATVWLDPGRDYQVICEVTPELWLYKASAFDISADVRVWNSETQLPGLSNTALDRIWYDFSSGSSELRNVFSFNKIMTARAKAGTGQANADPNFLWEGWNSFLAKTWTAAAGQVWSARARMNKGRFTIIDLGLADTDLNVLTKVSTSGSAAEAPVTGTTSYTREYVATWTQSYDGGGAQRAAGDTKAYQGYTSYWPGGGTQRSLIGFNDAQIRADLAGATVESIEAYLYFEHWNNGSGGSAGLGTHGNAAKPATFGGSTAILAQSGSWPRGAGRWVKLPTSEHARFQSGAARGVSLQAPGTGSLYYGYAAGHGAGSRAPKLRIKYKK